MSSKHRWIIALLVAACLPFAACKKMESVAEEEGKSPAKIERPNGEDQPAKITLDEEAIKRLDLQTATIDESDVKGAKQKSMPYAALLYDKDGKTWAFANPEPQTYMREPIEVDRIEGEKVYLAQGPAKGTKIVTVGAELLFGSEEEFEEE